MTIIAIIPALVCLIGLLLWVLASNPKVSEAGKWMFVCGLLVTLFVMSKNVIRIG